MIARYCGHLWFDVKTSYRVFPDMGRRVEVNQDIGNFALIEGDEVYKLTDQEVYNHVMLEDI